MCISCLLTSCHPVIGIWRSVPFIPILIRWLSWVRTSQFCRFVWSSWEWGYITQTLQWTEALKLFNNSNWSLSYATQFSWSWGRGRSGSHYSFSAKEGKILKYTKTRFGVGWEAAVNYSQIFTLCWGFWNLSYGKKQGMSFNRHIHAGLKTWNLDDFSLILLNN